MIRRLEGERPAFVLDTQTTTYVLSVAPSGHVEHLLPQGKKQGQRPICTNLMLT